jgi:acetaldehyde dehydrogenase (acetylating)
MSLDATEKAKLVKITGRNILAINQQIDAFSDDITDEMYAEIIAEIARWDAGAGTNFASFTPTESNEGFNQSADAIKNDIITNIESLMFFNNTAASGFSGNSDQVTFTRG